MAEPRPSDLPRDLTVDAFLAWAEGQPGRYELELGQVLAMAPEQARHNRAKRTIQRALETALHSTGAPCEAFADGMTVRIDRTTAYEPDAVVHCGKPVPADEVEVSNPVVVVEVVSPSSGSRDHNQKLVGYFLLPSIEHYLIVHPDRRILVHHAREGDTIRTRILGSGPLRLDPPGLDLAVEDLFRPEAADA